MSRVARSLAIWLLVAAAGRADAQARLLDVRTLSSGAVAEHWSFGKASPNGGAQAVSSASQFTVPFTAVIPIVPGWAFDSYVAYAHGTVTLDRGTLGHESLSLSGVNDAKVRLVGKLRGDNLLLTLGASLPSGTTALSPSQLQALSVLASPALRFRTPTLGTGPSGTGGLVVAGQAGSWAVALAGAYEKRGDYAPSEALTAGLDRPAFKAGDAMHLSFGADRLVQSARQSISVIADFYSGGELREPGADVAQTNFHLGPTVTATYQVQSTIGDVESMLYLLQRFRGNYSIGGVTVPNSWRGESEIGFANAIAMTPQVALQFGIDSRFHTAHAGDVSDQTISTFATAGMLAGGATIGLAVGRGSFLLEPFLRGQIGQLDLGGAVRHATGASAGLTLTARF